MEGKEDVVAIARIKNEIQRRILLKQAIEDNLSLNQIRAWIKTYKSKPEPQSPKVQITNLHRRLLKAKLWEDPQQWAKAEALLSEVEVLIDQHEKNN